MSYPLHVGLLYGGLSSEHDVSILSARNVHQALEAAGHRVTPIRIGRDGRWHAEASPDALFADGDRPRTERATHLVPGAARDAAVRGHALRRRLRALLDGAVAVRRRDR